VAAHACVFEVFPPLNELLQLSSLSEASHHGVAEMDDYAGGVMAAWMQFLSQNWSFRGMLSFIMIADTALVWMIERNIVRRLGG